MDISVSLCRLIEAKKEKFLKYEQATLSMLDCGVDDVEHYIIQRANLANEIDEMAEGIARLCDDCPDKELLMNTALAKVSFERVPGEYHCVYYAAQGVQSVANRIAQTEKQVVARLQGLREDSLKSIREKQNLPKIKKYLTDLTPRTSVRPLMTDKA